MLFVRRTIVPSARPRRNVCGIRSGRRWKIAKQIAWAKTAIAIRCLLGFSPQNAERTHPRKRSSSKHAGSIAMRAQASHQGWSSMRESIFSESCFMAGDISIVVNCKRTAAPRIKSPPPVRRPPISALRPPRKDCQLNPHPGQ